MSVLVAVGIGGIFLAPLVLVGVIAMLTSALFAGAQEGTAIGLDPALVGAAEEAATECESATAARLLAAVTLPPPGEDSAPTSRGTDTMIRLWGQVLADSGQYEALGEGDGRDLDTDSATAVLGAIGRIWCALYPVISEHEPDTEVSVTYLALGWARSTTEALKYEPGPGDQIRVQHFESLTATYAQQLAQAATAGTGLVSAAGWTHPIPGMSKYQGNYGVTRTGYTHAGEDLSAPMGTPIYAAAAGTVVHVACHLYQGRSPCNVIIDHGTDTTTGLRVQTWYVHMFPTGVLVDQGDQVTAGEQIALTGSNGNSTGPHLHLEVHSGGHVVDPADFFAAHGIDLRNPATAPPVNDAVAQALVWARTQIGVPYELGAGGPDAYDCSGLTMRAYEHAGLHLPRTSRQQYAATTRITAVQLQPGDLVFWSADGTAEGIYHVALFAGDGQIIQAPAPGRSVEEQVLWQEDLYGYGRVT